jgi:hypothetical protein
MAIKIAGIITLGIVCLGFLVYSFLRADQHAKQDLEDRKQRLVEKDHADNFTLNLFNMILEDDQLRNEQLVATNARKDETIEALNRKIQKMRDIANKCKLADLFQSVEEEENA